MSFEEPAKPRYQIESIPTGMRVLIPSKKNWFMILFLGFWLMGWAVGEITVTGALVAGVVKVINGGLDDIASKGAGAFGGLFMIAWLGAWTVGGAFAIYAWLWQVKGVEEVVIAHDGFCIKRRTPVWTRTKNYHLHEVKSLRASQAQASIFDMSRGMEFWGISGGVLAFDYGAKTVRFGIGLDEAEAKQILGDVRGRFPNLFDEPAQAA